ncbi:MAG TPA: hypothetical protein VIO94_14540, partial [Phenylobacterium sp.]
MDAERPQLLALSEAGARPFAFEARPDVRPAWIVFVVLTGLAVIALMAPLLTPGPLWARVLA